MKAHWRQHYLQQRLNISAEQKWLWDTALFDRLSALLPLLPGRVLALYVPIRGEPDLMRFAVTLKKMGYVICLPYMRVAQKTLSFWYYDPERTALVPSHAGIPTPDRQQSFPIWPDIVLLPCVAFHPRGYRLGYGGGYFDRTFADNSTVRLLGMAYEQSRLDDDACMDPHDRRLDLVVTESRHYCAPRI